MTHPLNALKGQLKYKPSEQLIDKYSFTGDILSFERCSKQYGKFKHYGFSKALPIQAWFGDVVHTCIEFLFRQVQGELKDSSGKVSKGALPSDTDVEFHAEESMKILKSKGMNGKKKDRLFVVELLKRFNKKEGLAFYNRIIKSEVRLETIISPATGMAPYVMNGIIDVLASPKKGVIEIWDYKAMEKPLKSDPKLVPLEDQMFNYVEIVQALFPSFKITSAVLYFVNELAPGGSGDPEHRIDLTDPKISAAITKARNNANAIVDEIRKARWSGKFPDPVKGSVEVKTCDACEWRWHCTSASKKYTLNAP